MNDINKDPRNTTDAAAARLMADIRIVDGWLEKLTDPVHGQVGAAFKKAVAATGCTEGIDTGLPYNATYNSFIYPPRDGQHSFTNNIAYGGVSLTSLEKLFAARVHEFIHALQYTAAPALHADPFNDATDIVLCPEDYVLRKERLEQDAYVKGAWLCRMAEVEHKEIADTMNQCPLPLDAYAVAEKNTPTLADAFSRAAQSACTAPGKWFSDNDQDFPATDAWADNALNEYRNIIASRLKSGRTIVFVRLEDADIHAIGAAFGQNTFEKYPSPATLHSPSTYTQEQIAALNDSLGITSRDALPTLAEALKTAGLTPEQFIEKSRTHTGHRPHPEFKA
jgi:hypothetical protein